MNGKLKVRLHSSSMFLTARLPIEVRNAQQEIVADDLRDGHELPLDVGLYSVSAILDDGSRSTQLIEIVPGGICEVAFPAREPTLRSKKSRRSGSLSESHADSLLPLLHAPELEYWLDGALLKNVEATRTMHISPVDSFIARESRSLWAERSFLAVPFAPVALPRGSSPNVTVSLLEREHALRIQLVGESGAASVIVSIGPETYLVRLPLSSEGPETSSCKVVVKTAPRRRTPAVVLDPRRRVVIALQGLMESGMVGAGLDLAKDAAELLARKYRDPVGAAYGALLLHRFNVLEEQTDWVENLARDFPWLPDGRILLAALLMKGAERDRKRGLDLLLGATSVDLPVLSDAIALAIALLRRWPGDESPDARQDRMTVLTAAAERLLVDSAFTIARWPSPRLVDLK